jgi:hypothetical protein
MVPERVANQFRIAFSAQDLHPMRLLQDAHGLSVASKQFCYCIRSSKSLKAALSLRAFLISS